MAYIEPNSTLILLHNCPLDKTYDHTIYFTSRSSQTSYFQSLAKASFSLANYTYIRQTKTIKVQASAGTNLYDCNYLMFKNTSFENKWFYAFITQIEYVNNITWEISFQLDVMQSWFFDYEMEKCFVEREHTVSDELFEHLVPENLETGEYISDGITRCADTGSATDSLIEDLSLVFACTFNRNYQDYAGGYYAGMYSGLCLIDFPFPNPATPTNINTFNSNVRTWIDGAVQQGKINGIITAFVMPTAFVRSDTSTTTHLGFSKTYQFNTIDGYTPKNKKLFSYPYNFLYCTNFQGNDCVYMFEYFSTPQSTPFSFGFRIEGNYAPNPEVVLTPLNYKGVGLSNYDERMSLGKYPQLPFASDVFQAWLSMDASGSIISLAGTVATGALGGTILPGIGTAAGAIGGFVVGISNLLAQGYKKDIAPPQNNGTTAGSHALASMRLIDFGFMNKHIRAEFAQIIDDYFSMFGYACHLCKVPNRNVRPHWTYTKTLGCTIVGSIPADDMKKICDIYNNGITFWKNGSEVGHYELDNSPT